MALSADRNTPRRDGDILTVPVAAAGKIYGGSIVCRNAAGYAVAGSSAAGLTYLGRADGRADNTGGAAGVIDVQVRRGVFRWDNHATAPITKAHVGSVCYIADAETVAAPSASGGSPAGVVVAVDDKGVWVETPRSAARPAILTATAVIDFASVGASAKVDNDITVGGAAIGDAVALGLPAAPMDGIGFSAFVSAADTVKVRAQNFTSVAVNPASATYRVTVIKS